MNDKNTALRSAIELYVKAALKLMSRGKRASKFPAGDWTQSPEFPFVFLHEELRALPEHADCLAALQKDAIIAAQLDAMVGVGVSGRRSSTAEELMLELPHMAVYKNFYEFNPEQFERQYKAFEAAFYDDHFKYEVIVPLSGPVFTQPLKLDTNLEICRVNRADCTTLINSATDEDAFLRGPLWAIRTNYDLPKRVGEDAEREFEQSKKIDERRENANEIINQVLICLRLFGTGSVYPLAIVHRTSPWLYHDVREFPIRYSPAFQFKTELETNFSEVFTTFWQNFRSDSVSKRKFIGLAAKRFSYAHERHDWEDRIVDLLIAAEAIFLPEISNPGELRYRLTLRAAILLGSNAATKKQIFDDMTIAYDLRSSIVHGSSSLDSNIRKIKKREQIGFGEEYKVNNFTYRVQEYLRCAICTMIHRAIERTDQKEVVDWDALILGGNSREADNE